MRATARSAALRALVALDRGEGERLRDELARTSAGLDARDRAFAFELAHGVARRERCLDHVLAGFAHRGLPPNPHVRGALRLGAYQLLFMPGMAAHAAVHETVELVPKSRGFVNAMLRQVGKGLVARAASDARRELDLGLQREFVLEQPLPDDEATRLAIVHSLPDFLVARWCVQFGVEATRGIAAAASSTPVVFLRVALGVDPDSLRAELAAAGIEVAPTAQSRLLRWTGGASPFATAAYDAGRFAVQDPTALQVAEAVPCGPGDTVVDLCAAPGTKTTALAERVRPGGRVFAFDVDPARRARIVENVARLRLQDVVAVVDRVDALPVADAVLADVPCSNTGVLARRVEVRRRLEPSTFAQLAALQRRLLAQAIALCKPGGAVVYSTCSIENDENDNVVHAVLADPSTPRCELGANLCTLPRAGECDGGYFAVLHRRR
jgi:16S rRNA (cytosine967-C5)-methyltransferase